MQNAIVLPQVSRPSTKTPGSPNNSRAADDKWYNTVFGGKDKNEGNVQLLDVKSKTMVWAGEAGDRSLWFGGWKRGGERKVADRIVSSMKKELFHM